MIRKYLLSGYELLKSVFTGYSFLLFNALTWYFMVLHVLDRLLETSAVDLSQRVIVMCLFYTVIVVSSFFGVFSSKKVTRRNLLLTWVGMGIVASFFPLATVTDSVQTLSVIAVLFGFSYGFGIPSCLASFADETTFENRGHIGGVIWFLASIFAGVFAVFTSFVGGLFGVLLYVLAWRSLGFYVLRWSGMHRIQTLNVQGISWKDVLKNSPFLLYVIPWFMFGLVDSLEKSYLQYYIQSSFSLSFYELNQLIEIMVGAFSALVVGVISDIIGRKRVIVYGFVSLGIAYAIVGVAPALEVSWIFYSVVDGIAWSIFLLMFLSVVWGDLSSAVLGRGGEKYYVLGGAPFFVSKLVGNLLLPYTQGLPMESAYAAFSLAAFFLFLAVVPLMYAPETMPEELLEARRLRSYVEKAKRIRRKYERKG